MAGHSVHMVQAAGLYSVRRVTDRARGTILGGRHTIFSQNSAPAQPSLYNSLFILTATLFIAGQPTHPSAVVHQTSNHKTGLLPFLTSWKCKSSGHMLASTLSEPKQIHILVKTCSVSVTQSIEAKWSTHSQAISIVRRGAPNGSLNVSCDGCTRGWVVPWPRWPCWERLWGYKVHWCMH